MSAAGAAGSSLHADTGRVLITGGAGFIGSHVVAALRSLGRDTVILDRAADSGPGVVVGDICDPDVVEAAVSDGVTEIVHLAAVTSVLRSVEHPELTYATNVAATATLLEAARRFGVRSFVFASTNAVVGSGTTGVIDESLPLKPLTPYGATKAAAEMLMSCYGASYGVRPVMLRLTNVYGPGMKAKDSIVPRLMRTAVGSKTFEIYGDGKQVRDYVNVNDVVGAVLLALGSTELSGPMVIGAGRSVSVLDLVELARDVTGNNFDVECVPAKPGEMPAVIVDNSRALAAGWLPKVTLEQGLAQVAAEWMPEKVGH